MITPPTIHQVCSSSAVSCEFGVTATDEFLPEPSAASQETTLTALELHFPASPAASFRARHDGHLGPLSSLAEEP